MTESPFPAPLDNLIAYVKSLQPGGGPLEHLSDAVVAGSRLADQADALIGHFVDQARRSGASWSEIGASMGVSKQAAQKKFVFRWEDVASPTPGGRFARFTDRARFCLLSAHASARAAGDPALDAGHLVLGLLAEPEGLAAVILHQLGATDDRLQAVFGPAAGPVDPAALADLASQGGTSDWLPISDTIRTVFKETLAAALHLGHNYIGTEHLLLGVVAVDGETTVELAELGVTDESVKQELDRQIAKIQALRARRAGGAQL
jgi:hypothetical protein